MMLQQCSQKKVWRNAPKGNNPMTKTHLIILAAFAALCLLSGCTTAQKTALTSLGDKAVVKLENAGLNAFEQWLSEQ